MFYVLGKTAEELESESAESSAVKTGGKNVIMLLNEAAVCNRYDILTNPKIRNPPSFWTQNPNPQSKLWSRIVNFQNLSGTFFYVQNFHKLRLFKLYFYSSCHAYFRLGQVKYGLEKGHCKGKEQKKSHCEYTKKSNLIQILIILFLFIKNH